MSDKIELKEKIQAVDLQVFEFWDEMDDENRKNLKKELFILNRYISNVKSRNRQIQEHYVLSVNEYYNKNFFSLQQHPKLLWKLLCLCGYNKVDTYYHEWIKTTTVKGSNNKKIQLLNEFNPNLKMDEIELLALITSDDDLLLIAKDHGYTEQEFKKKLK